MQNTQHIAQYMWHRNGMYSCPTFVHYEKARISRWVLYLRSMTMKTKCLIIPMNLLIWIAKWNGSNSAFKINRSHTSSCTMMKAPSIKWNILCMDGAIKRSPVFCPNILCQFVRCHIHQSIAADKEDGWYMDGEEKIDQEMYFCRDMDEEVVPKGLKQILVERGIEVDKLHNALKKDNPYCEIIFFPRYHCELNPIENVWMISKQKFRLEQDFESKTHAKMIETINNCLDAIPLDTIQRFVQTSIMYCELYRTGNGSEAALEKIKEIKKLKRKHRRAPLMQINHN
eukprot:212195_1